MQEGVNKPDARHTDSITRNDGCFGFLTGRGFSVSKKMDRLFAPTKMLISLEGAHVFWMSIFGELEQLRGPTCRSPNFPAECA